MCGKKVSLWTETVLPQKKCFVVKKFPCEQKLFYRKKCFAVKKFPCEQKLFYRKKLFGGKGLSSMKLTTEATLSKDKGDQYSWGKLPLIEHC